MCATTISRAEAREGTVRGQISTKSQSQVQVDDGYLLALAKQGSPDAYERLVRRYYSFVRLKASSYFLIGATRTTWSRRAGRPLQGDPRLPHGPRVVVPQLRGALHHAPDHHRGEDGDPQQAHAAQRLRLVLLDAGGRHATASRRSTRCCPARRSTTRSTRSSPPRSCARWSPACRRCCPSWSPTCSGLYLDGHSYTGIGEQLGCDCKTVDNALQRVKRKVGAHLRSRDVLL